VVHIPFPKGAGLKQNPKYFRIERTGPKGTIRAHEERRKRKRGERGERREERERAPDQGT
jgi:hypothetical protein